MSLAAAAMDTEPDKIEAKVGVVIVITGGVVSGVITGGVTGGVTGNEALRYVFQTDLMKASP